MEQIFGALGIDQLSEGDQNRIIYSMFCLLIAGMLFYFWAVSKGKEGAKVKNGDGLIYISLAYLFYFLIGFISIFFKGVSFQIFPILSGIISLCFLSSLSFFSLSSHPIDRIIENPNWQNVIKLLGLLWLIIIILGGVEVPKWVFDTDNIISALAMSAMGFFVTRYLVRRGLKLLGIGAVIFFVSVILLQIQPPKGLIEGKFSHISTLLLGPALSLSVVIIAFTFNWINELNFYELSSIWVGKEEKDEPAENYSQLTFGDNKKEWIGKIAKDDIEKVIDEMIIYKRHNNQNLEMILNIASRNTRNNNNRLKDIISYEDYQLNRNKISNSLIEILS